MQQNPQPSSVTPTAASADAKSEQTVVENTQADGSELSVDFGLSEPDKSRLEPESPGKPIQNTGGRDNSAPVAETSSLQLSREMAVMEALRNNSSLKAQNLTPQRMVQFEQIEQAVFDPNLILEAQRSQQKTMFFFPGIGNLGETEIDQQKVGLNLNKRFSSGTQIEVSVSDQLIENSRDQSWFDALPNDLMPIEFTEDSINKQHQFRTGITVSQALLRGAKPAANLARVRQAHLDQLASDYELKGYTADMIARVETLYWEYVLATEQLEIVKESLNLAQQQADEIRKRVLVGQLAEVELPAASAEVALRRQALINVQNTRKRLRLQLWQQIYGTVAPGWDTEIEPTEKPDIPQSLPIKEGVEMHVALSKKLRPDLNQARLQLQRGKLDVELTRNGLLPRLDLFINLGKSGFAASFSDASSDWDDDQYDASVGVRLEHAMGRRKEKGMFNIAQTSLEQLQFSLENLEELSELDVRQAYLEVQRANEQIDATKATRALQEVAYRAELQKFRVGRSTTLLVNRAQRDLMSSKIDEVQAIIDLRKAVLELYRREGSLLERRGIEIDGAQA